jgi:hypothetical protein
MAKLKGLAKLEYLTLQRVPITDAGLLHLADLPKLESIDAMGTLVTRFGSKAIEDKKPNINVSIGRY